jgi:hypothetical protein
MNRWVASRHVDVAGISSASTAGMCTPEAYERQHMGDDGDGAKELLHAIARGGVPVLPPLSSPQRAPRTRALGTTNGPFLYFCLLTASVFYDGSDARLYVAPTSPPSSL